MRNFHVRGVPFLPFLATLLTTLLSPGLLLATTGVCIPGQVIAPQQYGGTPIPHAQVRVCSSTASGVPCSPLASGIFYDKALTQPITAQPFTTDAYGNWQFCAALSTSSTPTSFIIQTTPVQGIVYVTYQTLPGGGGGTVTPAGPNLAVQINTNGALGGSANFTEDGNGNAYLSQSLQVGTTPTNSLTLQAPSGMTDNPVQTFQDASGIVQLTQQQGNTSVAGNNSVGTLTLSSPPVSCAPGVVNLGGTISTCSASTLGCLNACCNGTACQIALLPAGGAVTATLSATPTTITSGGSSVLIWASTNATSCTGTNFTVPGSSSAGSASVSPTTTTTYTVTCNGVAASAVVTVGGTTTVSLSASPTSIVSGSSSTLTWGSTGATSCTGTNFTISGSTTSGTATVSPTTTTTYTATCNSVAATATVTVSSPSILPTPPSNAFVFSNVQTLTPWSSNSLGSQVGGSGTSNSQGSVALGISSPSRTGAAMQISSFGNGVDTLATHQFGCFLPPGSKSATNGTLYISATGAIQSSSSVLFTASASDTTYTVTAIQIYLDGNPTPIFDSSAVPPITPISYTVTGLTPGTHLIVVKAWDSHGTNTPVSYSINTGGVTCGTISNVLEDFYAWFPSTNYQQIETDPDMTDASGYTYKISFACLPASNLWRLWNTLGNNWVTTSYPCTIWSQTNQWHHYQFYGTYNQTAHTYTYQTLVVDGTTVFANLGTSYSAIQYSPTPWAQGLWVENQVDNNSSAGTTGTNIVIDSYTVTFW